ncbi:hypothetical protein NESM_000299500 [Novymonas esmeraldas]|uniref:Uncharacterized protein n=1 Tax=Novymonas esmeraldas TaxID=1808958 RepID=A0AAW0FDW7_9TRYP
MSSSSQPAPAAQPRWQLCARDTASGDLTRREQLETFLRERLEHWERDSAEVVAVWGEVGGMCSAVYQSQLRKARMTLGDVRKRDALREASVHQTRQDTQTRGHRRHRDRLAADSQTRTQAKLNASQRQRERQQQRRHASAPAVTSRHSSAQVLPTVCAAPSPAAADAPPVPAVSAPLTPAPPTTPAGGPRRASGSSAAPQAPTCVRALDPGAVKDEESGAPTLLTSQLGERSPSTLSRASSSLMLSTGDERDTGAAAAAAAAAGAPVGGSHPTTFLVRRRISTRGHVSPTALIPTHRSIYRALVTSSSPPPVAPASPRPATRTSRHRSLSAPDAELLSRTVSPTDPSLPFPSRDVTAIFASRSRSQEAPSASHGRCGAAHEPRRGGGPSHAALADRRGGTESPERVAAAPSSQFISPIKASSRIGDLSSVSSAGSYLS